MKKLTSNKAPRLATEREVWQRVQKRGKKRFLLRSTLAIGALVFLLALVVDRVWKHHPVPLTDLFWQAAFALFTGYNIASLLWTRGDALVNAASRRRR